MELVPGAAGFGPMIFDRPLEAAGPQLELPGYPVGVIPIKEGVIVLTEPPESEEGARILSLTPIDSGGAQTEEPFKIAWDGGIPQASVRGEVMLFDWECGAERASLLMQFVGHSGEGGKFSVHSVAHTPQENLRGMRAILVSPNLVAVEESRHTEYGFISGTARSVRFLDASSGETAGRVIKLAENVSLLRASQLPDGNCLWVEKNESIGSLTVRHGRLNDFIEGRLEDTQYRGQDVQFGRRLEISGNGDTLVQWDRSVFLVKSRTDYPNGAGCGYQDVLNFTSLPGSPKVLAGAVRDDGQTAAAALHRVTSPRSEIHIFSACSTEESWTRYELPRSAQCIEVDGLVQSMKFFEGELHVIVKSEEHPCVSGYLRFSPGRL